MVRTLPSGTVRCTLYLEQLDCVLYSCRLLEQALIKRPKPNFLMSHITNEHAVADTELYIRLYIQYVYWKQLLIGYC